MLDGTVPKVLLINVILVIGQFGVGLYMGSLLFFMKILYPFVEELLSQ
jgi:hypothetical protein